MTSKIIVITIVAYLKIVNTQYYSPPYQPYNYYQSPLELPSAYPTPSFGLPPSYPTTNMYAPPLTLPYSAAQSYEYSSLPAVAPPIPNYPPFAPMPISPVAPMQFAPSTYPSAPTYATPTPYPQIPAYAIQAIPTNPSYEAPIASPTSISAPQIGLSTQKYSQPSAIAYYLTAPETPKAAMVEKVKENVKDKLPPPTYPCPFCTGFANVLKNSKVQPPPPCSSVLPGILDKIPTIPIPDELNLKELGKLAKPCSPLSDLIEQKLSKKLRFDQDLLDGFLTGLGFGKL